MGCDSSFQLARDCFVELSMAKDHPELLRWSPVVLFRLHNSHIRKLLLWIIMSSNSLCARYFKIKHHSFFKYVHICLRNSSINEIMLILRMQHFCYFRAHPLQLACLVHYLNNVFQNRAVSTVRASGAEQPSTARKHWHNRADIVLSFKWAVLMAQQSHNTYPHTVNLRSLQPIIYYYLFYFF